MEGFDIGGTSLLPSLLPFDDLGGGSFLGAPPGLKYFSKPFGGFWQNNRKWFITDCNKGELFSWRNFRLCCNWKKRKCAQLMAIQSPWSLPNIYIYLNVRFLKSILKLFHGAVTYQSTSAARVYFTLHPEVHPWRYWRRFSLENAATTLWHQRKHCEFHLCSHNQQEMFSSHRSFLKLGESCDPRFKETGFNEINETVFLTSVVRDWARIVCGQQLQDQSNMQCAVFGSIWLFCIHTINTWEVSKLKEELIVLFISFK